MPAKTIPLPNARTILVADPGHVMCEVDLKGADAQVVAWEADDADLKKAFREGLDVHQFNADSMGVSRQYAKTAVHATNYGSSARTVAVSCRTSIDAAKEFQARWFRKHPGIKEWHERTMKALNESHMIENAFGYRCTFLDRPSNVFRAALAWVPQGTVACVTNRAWVALEEREVEVLLSVHDSLVFQVSANDWPARKGEIHEAIRITAPYADPLTIPWDLQVGDRWGECQKESW